MILVQVAPEPSTVEMLRDLILSQLKYSCSKVSKSITKYDGRLWEKGHSLTTSHHHDMIKHKYRNNFTFSWVSQCFQVPLSDFFRPRCCDCRVNCDRQVFSIAPPLISTMDITRRTPGVPKYTWRHSFKIFPKTLFAHFCPPTGRS